jgi:hypothetical protein
MRAENASSWWKDALAGVWDATPWAVVLVGRWAAIQLAPGIFEGRRDADPPRTAASSPWVQELVGQRILLPRTDLNGRPVPRGEGTIVLSVACSECSSPEALLSLVSAAPSKPVVLISTEFTPSYRAVLDASKDVRLVQWNRESSGIPREMLSKAPQAAVLDARGIIREVPQKMETLKAFIQRLGGKK